LTRSNIFESLAKTSRNRQESSAEDCRKTKWARKSKNQFLFEFVAPA